jgi:hypothetical protein
MTQMRRYMIERAIPGVGSFSMTELCGAARASNQALETIGPGIQWQHSYVAGDKTFASTSPRTRRRSGSTRS